MNDNLKYAMLEMVRINKLNYDATTKADKFLTDKLHDIIHSNELFINGDLTSLGEEALKRVIITTKVLRGHE